MQGLTEKLARLKLQWQLFNLELKLAALSLVVLIGLGFFAAMAIYCLWLLLFGALGMELYWHGYHWQSVWLVLSLANLIILIFSLYYGRKFVKNIMFVFTRQQIEEK